LKVIGFAENSRHRTQPLRLSQLQNQQECCNQKLLVVVES